MIANNGTLMYTPTHTHTHMQLGLSEICSPSDNSPYSMHSVKRLSLRSPFVSSKNSNRILGPSPAPILSTSAASRRWEVTHTMRSLCGSTKLHRTRLFVNVAQNDIQTHTHTRTHTHAHTRTHIHPLTHTRAHTHTHTYIIYINRHRHTHAYTYAYTF